MFASATRTPFGTNTGFGFGSGAQQNPFASAPQIFSNNTFGPATPAFGQTSTNMFGSTPQPAPLFGSTTTPSFGATNPNTFGSTGLFGQQNQPPQNTGIFGGPSTSFGQTNKPSGFSFPSQTNIFGQAPQQQPAQTNVFQTPSSSSIFGSSGFGAQPAQSGTVIKFVPVTGSDSMQKSGSTTMINTKHHSITCMKEYESKSFEELRCEDYTANRKGPQQSTGFGSPAPAFGAGAATTSLFGQTENKPAFGSTNGFGQTSTFGVTNQASTSQGIFAKPATGFGTTVTTASSFGFPTSSTNIFGSNNAKPFGAQPSQSLFATTPQQPAGFSNSFFGQPTNQQPAFPAQAGSFSFGQPAASTQSSLFQTTKPSTGFCGIFSNNQPAGNTTFGQPTTSGFSGFNSTFTKPVQNTFGQQTQQQTGFGTGLSLPTNNLFSGIGAKPSFGTGTTGTGLFSTSGLQINNPSFSLQPQAVSQPIVLSAQPQTLEMRGMFNLSDPYGLSPHLDGLTACKSELTHYVTNPKELDDVIKKQDFAPSASPGTKKLKLNAPNSGMNRLFEEAYEAEESALKTFGIRRNPKRLVIKTPPIKKPEPLIIYHNGKIVDSTTSSSSGNLNLPSAFQSPTIAESDPVTSKPVLTVFEDNNESAKLGSPIIIEHNTAEIEGTVAGASITAANLPEELKKSLEPSLVVPRSEADQPVSTRPTNSKEIDTCGIICTRPEYYTIPPLNEIITYRNTDGSCFIKGFTIGRIGYGNVYFPDVMDVSNLNIDEIVHFRFREIIIYTDDDTKPTVGEGLNRRAQVTLDRVYPRKQENDNEYVTEPEEIIKRHYTDTLKFACERANTTFVDYRPETGSWVFNVVHFSKYTLSVTEERICEKKSTDKDGGSAADQLPSKELVVGRPDVDEISINNPSLMEVKRVESSESVSGLIHAEDYNHPSYTITSVTDPIVDLNISTNNFFPMDTSDTNILLMRSMFYDDNINSKSCIIEDSDLTDVIAMANKITSMEEHYGKEANKKPKQIKREIYTVLNTICKVPAQHSLIPSKGMTDAIVLKGKSFKVGWTHGFTVVTTFSDVVDVPCAVNSLESYVYNPTQVSLIDVSQCSLQKNTDDPFMENLPQFMEVVLEHSRCIKEIIVGKPKRVPRWVIKEDLELIEDMGNLWKSYCGNFQNHPKLQYYTDIWNLCFTFWGPIVGKHDADVIRKQGFNDWLESVTEDRVAYLMQRFDLETVDSQLKKMLLYLSSHQIYSAAHLASKANLPQLSLLLSQLNTNNLMRYSARFQIKKWEDSGTIELIQEDHLKLYIIICGAMFYNDLSICEGLDWLRALGMHLWYLAPSTYSVKQCIEIYDNAFMVQNYVKSPYPIFGSAGYTWDIMYYIMKLYCDRRLDLDVILSPATHTDDCTDYRLSWLLMQLFQSLKVGIVTDNARNQITTLFAAQLEQLGYYKWSIFVALFLKDMHMRKNLVFGILDRNLSDSVFDRNTERELVTKFKVPAGWIHRVKALKTNQLERYWESYRHLAYSEQWNESHDIFIHKIVPEIVCNHHFGILKDVLSEMSHEKDIILLWNVCGGFLLEFANIWSELNEIGDLMRLDAFKVRHYNMVSEFAWKVGNYPLTSKSQSMVVSEVSQKIENFFSELLITFPIQKELYMEISSNVLRHLVMPRDFNLKICPLKNV